MSLFDKFQSIIEIRSELEKLGIMPFGAVTEKILSATEGIVNGHKVILAGTNNYLGLTFDPECVAAAVKAVEEQGTKTRQQRSKRNASRMLGNRLRINRLDLAGCCFSAFPFNEGRVTKRQRVASL